MAPSQISRPTARSFPSKAKAPTSSSSVKPKRTGPKKPTGRVSKPASRPTATKLPKGWVVHEDEVETVSDEDDDDMEVAQWSQEALNAQIPGKGTPTSSSNSSTQNAPPSDLLAAQVRPPIYQPPEPSLWQQRHSQSFLNTSETQLTGVRRKIRLHFRHIEEKHFTSIWKGTFDSKDLNKLADSVLPSVGAARSRDVPETEKKYRNLMLGFEVYGKILCFLSPNAANDLQRAFAKFRMRVFQNLARFTLESVQDRQQYFVGLAIQEGQDNPASWNQDDSEWREMVLTDRPFRQSRPPYTSFTLNTTASSPSPSSRTSEPCFSWNSDRCKEDPCIRHHICRWCLGQHEGYNCPQRQGQTATATSSNAIPVRFRAR